MIHSRSAVEIVDDDVTEDPCLPVLLFPVLFLRLPTNRIICQCNSGSTVPLMAITLSDSVWILVDSFRC